MLNKYEGLRVSIEGHFENSSRSYEYLLTPTMIDVFINWLLYHMEYRHLSLEFEKNIFYTRVDTPYGKNKKFYFTNVHPLRTDSFKIRDTKATKVINEVFFEEEIGPNIHSGIALSKSYLKDASLTDKDVEELFGKDFPDFFGKNNDNEGEDKNMNTEIMNPKNMNTEKQGFSIPGLKNVGKQLTGIFAFSIITQKLAVKMDDAHGYFSFDTETKTLTDENGFIMEIPFPAMVLPERFSKLKPGDLVISPEGNKLVFVVDVDTEAKTYNYVGANGIVQNAAKVQNAIMKDLDFVEKVINPLADAFGGNEDDGLFDNPMMMMALMNNGGNIFGGNNGNNDMLSMLMLSKMMKK